MRQHFQPSLTLAKMLVLDKGHFSDATHQQIQDVNSVLNQWISIHPFEEGGGLLNVSTLHCDELKRIGHDDVAAALQLAATLDAEYIKIDDAPQIRTGLLKIYPFESGDPGPEVLPGATRMEVLDFNINTIEPAGDDISTAPLRKWVESVASYWPSDAKQSAGGWDYVVNLAMDLGEIPEPLQYLVSKARAKGFCYIVFHQGT
jgi:hypothetical protein